MSENLACPLCGGQRGSHVTDTRQCADAILRFRRCFDCHNLFDTVERADGPDPKGNTLTVFDNPQTSQVDDQTSQVDDTADTSSVDENPTPSPAMSDDPNDPRLVPKPVVKRKYTRKTSLSTE